MARDPGSKLWLPRLFIPLAAILFVSACGHVQSSMDRILPGSTGRMARSVTIYRDEWGVPHIYGPSDASVVFGMAYAQAEDNFWQIEDDFIRDLGRAAEVYGEVELEADLVRAAFEVERLSREEYEREPPERRRIWDAFARGLNYYLDTHPEVQPRLLTRFEPWFVFARFRSASPSTTVDGIRLGGVVATPVDEATGGGDWQQVGVRDAAAMRVIHAEEEEYGSNTWAASPARTVEGHALLFQNPHVGFFGSGQRYEVHVQSEQGWHFSGFAILGTPMPRAGHNEHLGWSHTNTGADVADAYELAFDHPTDPLAYRYGDGWRQAVEWGATLGVRTDAGIERRRFRFRKTHHGPVVANAEGKPVAVRLARFEEGGSLQQWYAMGKATSLEEFLAALGLAALPISNTMYADTAGNILYVHGNAVPRRAAGQQSTRPVDGSNPANEWQGYHALDELPQLLNPPSGWLQNTNSTPFLATAEGHNPDREAYAPYMAPESDNGRARASRMILASEGDWTLEEFERAAFDTRVIEAQEQIPLLIDEWERFGAREPERAAVLDTAIHELFEWDQISTPESVAMTYFLLWLERMRRPGADTIPWPRVTALEETVNTLIKDWGLQRVPWGEVNRLQRIHTSGLAPFDDAKHSLPIAGAPGWAGIVFSFYTRSAAEGRRRYGTSGHTWVSVVEFAPRIRARAVVTFGQSANPASPHWFDQAPLYAEGRFREAWFWREDVESNARVRYRPGQPSGGG